MNSLVKRWLLLAAVMAMLTACATAPEKSRQFTFALMGDTQYTPLEEKLFPQMLDAVSAEDLVFVVHIGDFKPASHVYSPCTDELFKRRLDEFNRSRHPFIFLPGDNDWTDCRRPSNGSGDPLERLEKIRQLFYPSPRALGRNAMVLERQSDRSAGDPVFSRYRENTLWTHNGLVFVAVNVQGSNDNRGFDAVNDREWAERTRANIAWFRTAIARARAENASGIVLFQQANPGFEENWASKPGNGFEEFLRAFEAEARAWGKPILFAHGDTHKFRIEPYRSPLDRREIANVTRLETYGSPFVNWVRISVDPENRANPFSIESGNFAPKSPD